MRADTSDSESALAFCPLTEQQRLYSSGTELPRGDGNHTAPPGRGAPPGWTGPQGGFPGAVPSPSIPRRCPLAPEPTSPPLRRPAAGKSRLAGEKSPRSGAPSRRMLRAPPAPGPPRLLKN